MSRSADEGLDYTHDPDTQSWVHSANVDGTDFPIQNLPLGRYRTSSTQAWRIGMAIGSSILDLQLAGLIEQADMAQLLSLPRAQMRSLRQSVWRGLRAGAPEQDRWSQALREQSEVQLGLP